LVIVGKIQLMIVQRTDTGIGSAGDELRLPDFTSLQILDMDILLKLACSGV